MVEKFTTDFVSVEDGDVTPYTPQELVQKNAIIDIVGAEVQWRGVSDVSFSTERDSRTNTDTESAFIRNISRQNQNSATGKTTGTVTTDVERKTDTVRVETDELRKEELSDTEVFAPFPEDPTDKYPNADVELESVEVNYFSELVNDTQVSISYIRWDGDPWDPVGKFNSPQYTDAENREILDYFTNSGVIKFGSYTEDVYSKDFYNRDNYSGGKIEFSDIIGFGSLYGSPPPILKLSIETNLIYTVRTREQELEQERISVTYPSIPSGSSFDYHQIEKYINGSYDGSERIYSNRVGEVYSELSPEEEGSEKEIIITTEATERETVSQTASVSYPAIEGGSSFNRHEIEVTENGNTVVSDTIYENRTGETLSRTSSRPTDEVTVTAKTFYSKTVKIVDKTTNPRIQPEYLPQTINTENVSLLFDTSGSADQRKQEELGRELVSQLGDSTNVSVIDFDYDAVELVSLDSLENNRSDVIDAINSLDAFGGTDLSVGLDKSVESFDGETGTIVVFSDGETGDNPVPTAEEIGDSGIQIVTVQVGRGETQILKDVASVSNGVFFDGEIDTSLFGIVLDDNELSEWKELTGITRDTQSFEHSIEVSEKAEFRFRFFWEYLTPEPTFGTTGFYDESAGVWREVAVTELDNEALQYNHVQVHNESADAWGALDVVDISNENALEAFQFYDEDVGWLAPRQFNTV